MKKISTVAELLKVKKVVIYIINYEPLVDRRKYLQRRIVELGLNKYTKWIIQKPNIYDEKIKVIYKENPFELEKRSKYVYGPKEFSRLSPGELNLTMNHVTIYKELVKKKQNALIFEDDVILGDDFLERLVICLENLPENFDVAYTDAGIHIRFPKTLNSLKYYLYSGFLTRATGSYFVSYEGAKKYLRYFSPVLFNDLNMRYLEKKYKMKVFWLNGYLTYQGSVFCPYNSADNLMRDEPSKIQKFIKSLEIKRFDRKISSKIELMFLDYFILIPLRIFKYNLRFLLRW